MSDAVRGDFERLRRRLEGADHKPPRPRPDATEPVVLTPPQVSETAPEPEPARGEEPGRDAPPDGQRSRLRAVFRRR